MAIKTVRHNQEGFTVVELIVTILVSVILIGSLSAVSNNNAFLTQRGRNLTSSNSFAENKVEQLRSKGYLALSAGTTDITNEMPTDLASPRSASLVVADVSAGLKSVSLTLSYNEQGKAQTQNYKTYIGELGVGQY